MPGGCDEEVLKIVRQGEGTPGRNPDYVRSTYEHLAGMGVIDPVLPRVSVGAALSGRR